MAEAADQQAQPDDAVADDHHRREDRIARQGRLFRAAGEHDRDDQRDLDHGDGNREHQRAERLAGAVSDDLGVMHRGEDRADQRDRASKREHRSHRGEQCDDQQRRRGGGHDNRPLRQTHRSGRLGLRRQAGRRRLRREAGNQATRSAPCTSRIRFRRRELPRLIGDLAGSDVDRVVGFAGVHRGVKVLQAA